VWQDEVPFLQLDGFAQVSVAPVRYSPAPLVSVSDPLPRVPESCACLGASGIHAEGGK